MATTFDDWTLDGLKNPLKLQSLILDRFESVTDGRYTIADANNVTSFLIESFASIASKAIQKIDDNVLPAIYPSRAQSATDLYKHLSDYDYLGLFAAPASSSIVMIVDRDYLMKNAIDVTNSDGTVTYRKVIIPQTTRFIIGSYTFGLYYPIEIRVSAQTGMFTVLYDTSVNNPLHVLSQNILEYSFRKHNNMNLAFIKIPVYQFNTITHEEPLIGGTGYRRVIQYSDQFYALKVTGEVRDVDTDTWSTQELSLALAGRTYNPEKPTVIFTVSPDDKQLILEIPYVFFTENRIRGNLRVDVYTTSGYLNYQIPTDTDELVGIDMFGVPLDSEVQKYAEPFRTMPALAATPVTMKIIGGTDGMSYSDLRRKVVNDAFGDVTLQTPADIDAYFKNEGYVTSLFKDGITDRIYNAHVVLRNSSDAIVAAGSINTLIDMDTLSSTNTHTIIDCGDSIFTILPSTRYRLDVDRGICVPLTDTELDILNGLSAADKVSAFNKNVYTLNPFHIQVSLKDKYPTTSTYDMGDADIESREFLTARDVGQHLSINSALMEVVPVDPAANADRVTDKYRLTFKVIRSGLEGFEAVVSTSNTMGRKNIRVIVGLKKVGGGYEFAEATYQGQSSDTDVFTMEISATAAFNQTDTGHTVRIKSPFSNDGVDVLLNTEVRVILVVSDEIENLKYTYRTDDHPDRWLLTDYTSSGLDDIDAYIALSEHRVNLRFGKLVNELDQRISFVYTGDVYKTYDTTKLMNIETPVYDLADDGSPKYHYEDAQGATVWTYEQIVDDSITKSLTGLHVVLNESYPIGTLKSYTNLLEESVVISRYLASNYGGCTYIDPSNPTRDEGGTEVPNWQATPLPQANAEGLWLLSGTVSQTNIELLRKLEGVETTIMAHVAPRFSITSAKITANGESPIVGAYELANAGNPNRGSYSTSADKWYHAFSVTSNDPINTNVTIKTTHTYCIRVVDSLKFIFDEILSKNKTTHVFDGVSEYEDDEKTIPLTYYKDPLKEFAPIYTEGMFVMIEHDASDAKSPESANFVDTTTGGDEDHPTKLYLRHDGQWKCIMMCNSYADLQTRLTQDANTRRYGYAYQLYRIERSEYNSVQSWSQRSTWSSDEVETEYVAFLINNDDGTPDFTMMTLDANDNNWSAKVNKWPWEVSNWRRLNTSAIEGSRVFEPDDQVVSAFDSTRMGKYCEFQAGQIKLGADGRPETDDSQKRSVQYLINMLHVDAKLAETSVVKETLTYPSEIVSTMRTHFENLGAIKNRLYTSTKLYFEPMKSLGYAEFYTDGENTSEYSLDITMGFRLHVSSDIVDDKTMMASMKASIIKLIDDHMASGTTNMAELANIIKNNNSDSVRYVDVLGIDGDSELQTMRCVESNVRPHLKHELVLLDDGVTIDLTRGLNLEFVVADV